MNCPACKYEQDDQRIECIKCGIVFSKYRATSQELSDPKIMTAEQPGYELGTQNPKKKGLVSLAIGLAIALIVMFLPFIRFIFSYFIILVHEFGHALTGWLFGYPSIPAFDFMYGGGITVHQERYMGIVWMIFIILGISLITFRKNRLSIIVILCLAGIYALFAFTDLHKILNLFMGHGAELIFSGIFLYRALSGTAIINPAERPLYAFLGFFVLFSDTGFAYKLMTSLNYRQEYGDMKGGGHWMDFSRIANEYLDVNLTTVAVFFFICVLATPVLTYLFFRYEPFIIDFIIKVIRKRPYSESN